jgi:hypothetical protein
MELRLVSVGGRAGCMLSTPVYLRLNWIYETQGGQAVEKSVAMLAHVRSQAADMTVGM